MGGAISRFVSKLGGAAGLNPLQPCSAATVNLFAGKDISSGAILSVKAGIGSNLVAQSNCFGCCGLGCRCIRDRYGSPIYSNACATHDRCVRNYPTGIGFVMADCQILFIPAAFVVFARTTPRIIIIRR